MLSDPLGIEAGSNIFETLKEKLIFFKLSQIFHTYYFNIV